MPRDAPSPRVSDTDFRLKAISLRRFGEYMREARAKHVLAVFDSCFGGTVFNVARALPPPVITHATALPVRQFISSGDAGQVVSDDGTFRRLFIDALQGAEPPADMNKDGYLTGTGLGQFLYNKMTNLTEQRQTPRYGKLNARGYDRGDFVFRVREPKAGAPLKPSPGAQQPPLSEAALAWAKIEGSGNIAVLEAFRKQFGAANPYYDTLAAQRIETLRIDRPAPEGGPASSWRPWYSGQQPEQAKPPPAKNAPAIAPAPSMPALTEAETRWLTASEAILIDVHTGAILFEKNAGKLFAPGSMSKIMTLEILFKKLKAGEISLETEFPVSEYAWRTGGAPSRTTSMFVPLNHAKVSDLFQGIAVQNANDACIAVAEGLAATDEAFARMMTDEARALGLEKSTFGNSTGLPHPGNLTTARELAKLSIHIIEEFPDYYAYFSQLKFKYRSFEFKNSNPFLNSSIPADGLKIGYTEGTGYGAAVSALKDGQRLIAITNGFESDRDRREQTVKLLSLGFGLLVKPKSVMETGQAR